MSGNGSGVPILGGKAEDEGASITFSFAPNGDLKAISGTVSMVQLLMVAFEATQLATGVRGQIASRAMQSADDISRIARDLEREQKHGRR